jgi:hypothetical protein
MTRYYLRVLLENADIVTREIEAAAHRIHPQPEDVDFYSYLRLANSVISEADVSAVYVYEGLPKDLQDSKKQRFILYKVFKLDSGDIIRESFTDLV